MSDIKWCVTMRQIIADAEVDADLETNSLSGRC